MQEEKYSFFFIRWLLVDLVLTAEMIEENAQQNPEQNVFYNLTH